MACSEQCVLHKGLHVTDETPDDFLTLVFCHTLHQPDLCISKRQKAVLQRFYDELGHKLNTVPVHPDPEELKQRSDADKYGIVVTDCSARDPRFDTAQPSNNGVNGVKREIDDQDQYTADYGAGLTVEKKQTDDSSDISSALSQKEDGELDDSLDIEEDMARMNFGDDRQHKREPFDTYDSNGPTASSRHFEEKSSTASSRFSAPSRPRKNNQDLPRVEFDMRSGNGSTNSSISHHREPLFEDTKNYGGFGGCGSSDTSSYQTDRSFGTGVGVGAGPSASWQYSSSSDSTVHQKENMSSSSTDNQSAGYTRCMLTPIRERLSFENFVTKDQPYLMMKAKVEDMNGAVFTSVNGPLGVCYDEDYQQWAVADQMNNRILLHPAAVSFTTPMMAKPSAVCVMDSGHTLAVLCDFSIVTYRYVSKQVEVIVNGNGHKLNCRGLARTPGGNLVTIRNVRGSVELVIYGTTVTNQEVIALPFSGSNASFLHMVGDRLLVSDLGSQTVTMCRLNDTNTKDIKFEILYRHGGKWDGKGEPGGKFSFVSGVQLDSLGYSIIADAVGHTFQLFDADLQPCYRICADFKLPYMSSFAVNNRGEVIICGRHTKQLYFAQLTSTATIIPREQSHGVSTGSFPVRGRGGSRPYRGRGGGAPFSNGPPGGFQNGRFGGGGDGSGDSGQYGTVVRGSSVGRGFSGEPRRGGW